MAPLRRWSQLSEFVRLLIWSGQVLNGRPQSCILMSHPGEGKTELLDRFNTNAMLDYYTDLTYRTVVNIGKKVARGQKTHVVCTEFQKVLWRRPHIVQSTLTLLLQAQEEGLTRVAFGPQEHNLCDAAGNPARFGLLAATTFDSVRKTPFMFEDLAMDSRVYVVDASASEEEIREIERRMIAGDYRALTKVVIEPPDRKVKVELPEPVGVKVQPWREEMQAAGVRTYGVRTMSRFLNTLKGVALADGSDVVRARHVEHLYSFRDFWLKPPPVRGDELQETRR